MNSAVKAGVILAVIVTVLSIGFYGAGLHENTMFGFVLLIAFILANVAVVIWGLKQSAADSPYVKQLMNGAVIGLVGGLLILAVSMLLQTVVFPDALQESRDATVSFLEGMNIPEDQLEIQIAKLDETTALSGAIQGFVGTFFTSLIVAAIAGIFLRKK